MSKWVAWTERPENKNWVEDGRLAPDPWEEWYEYYDPTPVSYPKKCKLTGIVVRNEEENLEHMKKYICKTNMRTFPAYLDSDHWEPAEMKNIKEIWGYSHDGHIVVKDLVQGSSYNMVDL